MTVPLLFNLVLSSHTHGRHDQPGCSLEEGLWWSPESEGKRCREGDRRRPWRCSRLVRRPEASVCVCADISQVSLTECCTILGWKRCPADVAFWHVSLLCPLPCCMGLSAAAPWPAAHGSERVRRARGTKLQCVAPCRSGRLASGCLHVWERVQALPVSQAGIATTAFWPKARPGGEWEGSYIGVWQKCGTAFSTASMR